MSFTNQKDSDNYATDKLGWEMIKEYIPTDKKIWAPFYCDGKQKDYFSEMGFDIIHEDEDFFLNDSCNIFIRVFGGYNFLKIKYIIFLYF